MRGIVMKKHGIFGIFLICFVILASTSVLQAKVERLEFQYESGYSWEGEYIYGAYPNETVQYLFEMAQDTSVIRVRNAAGNFISGNAKLYTGIKVQLYAYNTVWDESSLVMLGDINGDGKINSADYIRLKRYFSGTELAGAYYEAADLNGDDRLMSADYIKLKSYFGGKLELFPQKGGEAPEPTPVQKYTGPYSEYNGAYGGVDDLGREQYYETQVSTGSREKDVGIFYFLWQGQHGTSGPYDNNKIVASHPEALLSEANWKAAGGGNRGAHHFWGEPLFGYYTMNDTWVMRKHVQMLTAAGVDYLVFDTTNGYTYDAQALKLLSVLDEYSQQGWDVPQIAYMTHSNSWETMQQIYENIYAAHPEYSHLWYLYNGKPMIIGSNPTEEVRNFFTVKTDQWPNASKAPNGFPWMEFSRWLTADSVYSLQGKKEIMNVSLAQHNATVQFSNTAWYGGNDRSRNYTGTFIKGLTSEQALLQGTNFAIGFDYALYQDPENIFITGWNEWVAQRQASDSNAIVFVDCADPNNSRDAEPMNGVLKDNYYMQMTNLIKEFKNAAPRVDVGENTTIDINGSFAQWDSATANYTDFTGDTVDRNEKGFGNILYTDTSGRNDFSLMKVAKDADTVYFYVKTVSDIVGEGSGQWMNLFIRSGTSGSASWEGFDYVINRTAPVDGKMTVEKNLGGWSWEKAGTVSYKQEGNQLMLAVPKAMLGIASDDLIDLQFKWADNCGDSGDVMTFYTKGDAAPYGRFTYIYSEKVK